MLLCVHTRNVFPKSSKQIEIAAIWCSAQETLGWQSHLLFTLLLQFIEVERFRFMDFVFLCVSERETTRGIASKSEIGGAANIYGNST